MENDLNFLFTYKSYTGIGSRTTPPDILALMFQLGEKLAEQGWILRSGAAPGADSAFEQGARTALFNQKGASRPEIYLPWEGFEGRAKGHVTRTEPQEEAYEIAEEFHPGWKYLKQGAKKLHARNVHQVLGFNVNEPLLSSFLICWTPGGKGSGGTGQALRIAEGYGIEEVYDLYNKDDRETIKEFLEFRSSA
jgi:hypothetical protein